MQRRMLVAGFQPEKSSRYALGPPSMGMYLSDFLPFGRLARLASSKIHLRAVPTYRDPRKILLRGPLGPLAPILGPRHTTVVRWSARPASSVNTADVMSNVFRLGRPDP